MNDGESKNLDLSNGFAVHAALKIRLQRGHQRSVLLDLWHSKGSRLQLYLDERDQLFWELTDRAGVTYRVGPVERTHFIERKIYLRAEIVPMVRRTRLALAVNNREAGSECFDNVEYGGPGHLSQTLGAAHGGVSHSTFSVAELVFSGAGTNAHNKKMWRYFRDRYAITPDLARRTTSSEVAVAIRRFAEHKGAPLSDLERAESAATEVIYRLLGREWMRKHLYPSGPSYMRPGRPDELDPSARYSDRVFALGEMLFNLQCVPGATERFADISRRDNLQAAVAELEAARHLQQRSIPFSFVAESGQRGKDYDLSVNLRQCSVALEVKRKIEDGTPSKKTLLNAFGKIRNQVPTTGPYVGCIRFPESWQDRSPSPDLLREAVEAEFRNTTRLHSILFLWEDWFTTQQGVAARCDMFKQYLNPRRKWDLPELNLDSAFCVPPNWLRLRDISFAT